MIYSDCLIETTNNENEMFGIKRLCVVFESLLPDLPAQKQADLPIEELNRYSGKEKYNDDLTVIVLKKYSL